MQDLKKSGSTLTSLPPQSVKQLLQQLPPPGTQPLGSAQKPPLVQDVPSGHGPQLPPHPSASHELLPHDGTQNPGALAGPSSHDPS
jgi:hypothetical protein